MHFCILPNKTPLDIKVNLNYIYIFISYRTVNTLCGLNIVHIGMSNLTALIVTTAPQQVKRYRGCTVWNMTNNKSVKGIIDLRQEAKFCRLQCTFPKQNSRRKTTKILLWNIVHWEEEALLDHVNAGLNWNRIISTYCKAEGRGRINLTEPLTWTILCFTEGTFHTALYTLYTYCGRA
jgi:hypothetical protein